MRLDYIKAIRLRYNKKNGGLYMPIKIDGIYNQEIYSEIIDIRKILVFKDTSEFGINLPKRCLKIRRDEERHITGTPLKNNKRIVTYDEIPRGVFHTRLKEIIEDYDDGLTEIELQNYDIPNPQRLSEIYYSENKLLGFCPRTWNPKEIEIHIPSIYTKSGFEYEAESTFSVPIDVFVINLMTKEDFK